MGSVTTDYFTMAVGLAREEGKATLQRVAAKNTALRSGGQVCACSAYRFPHRPGSGNCPAPEPGVELRYSTDPRPMWEAEERRLFEAAEARAMSSGAW